MSSSKDLHTIAPDQAQRLRSGPVPQSSTDTSPFWSAANDYELRIPFCVACERHFFYPRPRCRYCDSAQTEWRRVSGRGRLLSYVINYKPFPEFESPEAQVIAIVGLEEGVNLLSQIVIDSPTPDGLPLGMPLEVVYSRRGDQMMPFFVPAAEEGRGDA